MFIVKGLSGTQSPVWKRAAMTGLFSLCALFSVQGLCETARIEADDKAQWKKVSSKDQASVWTREVIDSPIKEVKLVVTFQAPVEQVWKTIRDVEHYLKFMPYLDAIEVMKLDGQDKAYIYHRVDPPLVSQRDYTLLIVDEVDAEKGHYYRYWTQKNELGPAPKKGVVRLTICDGSWTLSATEDGKTKASYWLYTDPAGRIPNWLANKVNKSALYDVAEAIEQRALDLSWQQ